MYETRHQPIYETRSKAEAPAVSAVTSKSKPQEAKRHASLISDRKLRQLYSMMLQSRMLDERARLLERLSLEENRVQDFPAGHTYRSARSAALIPNRCAATESMTMEERLEAIAVGCTISLRSHDAVSSMRHAQAGQWLSPVQLPQALAKLYRHPKPAENISGNGVSAFKGARGSASGSALPDLLRLAEQLKKTNNVVVTFLAPEFHSRKERQEAFAVAAKDALPVLFVAPETASEAGGDEALQSDRNLRKLHSNDCGMPGTCVPAPWIPVDKHDVVAVYRVAYESIQRARRCGGPTVIECKTYRLEKSKKRRSESYSVADAGDDPDNPDDPIDRMQLYLERKGLFDLAWKDKLTQQFREMLDSGLK